MFHEISFRINIDIDSESVLGLNVKVLNVFIIVGGSRNKQLKTRLYTF